MVLNKDDQRNRDRLIPRIAMKNYKKSPFEYFYNSLNDQALLNATGHDHCTLNILLTKI